MAVEDEGAQHLREGMKVWTCKIGECAPRDLPVGADYPMRRAIEEAYRSLTGHDPDFIFSGWGGELTVSERAVHERRVPDPDAIIAEARRTIDRATEMIDGAVRAKAV